VAGSDAEKGSLDTPQSARSTTRGERVSSTRRPRAGRPDVDVPDLSDLADVAVPAGPLPDIVVAVPDEAPVLVGANRAVVGPVPVVATRRFGRRNRPRVRRVTRVVRHVDTWSVLKISAVFYLTISFVLLVAGVLLWTVAVSTGTVANVERFIRDLFALDTFAFSGGAIFHASWIIGAFLVVGGTGLNVTMAVLFNLISDLVGGLRITVLEEEVVLSNVIDDDTTPPGNV